MTKDELRLETIKEPTRLIPGMEDRPDVPKPTEFHVIGSMEAVEWLIESLRYMRDNRGVDLAAFRSNDDNSTLVIRVVPNGVRA